MIIKDLKFNSINSNNSMNLVSYDTDGIKFTKSDQSPWSETEKIKMLDELNSLFPEMIRFESDGYFQKFVTIKAKNYIMVDESGKLKMKGSALKSSKLEPALKRLQTDIINHLIERDSRSFQEIYEHHCKLAYTITDIKEWSSRKTISDRTVKSERKNETSIIDALGDTPFQLGDKFQFYSTMDKKLKLVESYNPQQPDHDFLKILKKIFNCVQTFKSVVDMTNIVNYGQSKHAYSYCKLHGKEIITVKRKKFSTKDALAKALAIIDSLPATHKTQLDESDYNYFVAELKRLSTPPKPKGNACEKKAKKKQTLEVDSSPIIGDLERDETYGIF